MATVESVFGANPMRQKIRRQRSIIQHRMIQERLHPRTTKRGGRSSPPSVAHPSTSATLRTSLAIRHGCGCRRCFDGQLSHWARDGDTFWKEYGYTEETTWDDSKFFQCSFFLFSIGWFTRGLFVVQKHFQRSFFLFSIGGFARGLFVLQKPGCR